jgi:hypothetical protein
MSVAVADAASVLSVYGRNDISLPDALQRRLAARVHLWKRRTNVFHEIGTSWRLTVKPSNTIQRYRRRLKLCYILM